jgi:hypothetical protein
MNHVRITFYIGLARSADPAGLPPEAFDVRADSVARLLGVAYEAGTVVRASGFWQDRPEPSMTFETIQPDSDSVRMVARQHSAMLAGIFGQDAIGLAFSPVTFELHGKDGIQ